MEALIHSEMMSSLTVLGSAMLVVWALANVFTPVSRYKPRYPGPPERTKAKPAPDKEAGKERYKELVSIFLELLVKRDARRHKYWGQHKEELVEIFKECLTPEELKEKCRHSSGMYRMNWDVVEVSERDLPGVPPPPQAKEYKWRIAALAEAREIHEQEEEGYFHDD